MKTLRNIFAVAALVATLVASAVPAPRTPRTFTQPDGSQVTLRLVGDEYCHYYITDDDLPVVSNNGAYYFARVADSGRPEASDVLASNPTSRNLQQQAFVEQMQPKSVLDAFKPEHSRMFNRQSERSLAPAAHRAQQTEANAIPQKGVGLFPGTTFPAKGSPKVLVIIAEYADVKFNVANPYEFFTNMLNKRGFNQNGATGSALDYFVDASDGAFTPQFDVYGPVTLPQKMAYYGGNTASGGDARAEVMIIDACARLDSQIDYTQYDVDKDGYVDNVYLFYAGYGEASSYIEDTVWPHQWELTSSGRGAQTHDGVKVNRYACSNEWDGGGPTGIGTFTHEFSHVIGLPDLYHTTSSAAYTPGKYSILDSGPYNNGGHTPPTYSAFERNALGWIDLKVITKSPLDVELGSILKTGEACIIQTSDVNEFFILENRQKESWDKYIPGHGMLIWHVDYEPNVWRGNRVNNTASHQYVDIEEACGSTGTSNTIMAAYPFPGTQNRTSFTDTTTPNMKTWSKQNLETPITDIAEKDGIITFKVCGGGASIAAPVVLEPLEVGSDYFVAAWEPVDQADDYQLTVRVFSDEVPENVNVDFGTGSTLTLPQGWTSSSSNCYTTEPNFGEASPALQLSADEDYLLSPVFETTISTLSMYISKGGIGAGVNNVINIYAINGATETLVATLENLMNLQAGIYNFNFGATSANQFKIVYDRPSNGLSVGIDDIVVEFNVSNSQVLPDYDGVSTSGLTNMRVDRLLDGVTEYMYCVKAVKSNGEISAPSQYQKVTLSDAGIENLECDTEITVVGHDVVSTQPMTIVDLAGRVIASDVCAATLPTGLYIVKTPTRTLKLTLR
ncbi:MAG: M6 family metalloprotease domain-containing protein [Muribaculaceae bacterium]|nr:M6 family metalloprotease domain-containing protein [Muribaculaceae bacterium]